MFRLFAAVLIPMLVYSSTDASSIFDEEVIKQRAKLSGGEANEYYIFEIDYKEAKNNRKNSKDGETEHYGEFEFDSPRHSKDNVKILVDIKSDIVSEGDCISVGSVDVEGVLIRKLTLDIQFEEIYHYNRDACIKIGNISGARYINEVDITINGDEIKAH